MWRGNKWLQPLDSSVVLDIERKDCCVYVFTVITAQVCRWFGARSASFSACSCDPLCLTHCQAKLEAGMALDFYV